MAYVLEFDGVTVIRRGRKALNGISFALDGGDFVALIGANGSGKTTLVRTALGFIRPASGAVRLFGQPMSGERGLRMRIGYVPQSVSIDFRMPMTVRDVVSMGRIGRAGLGRRLSVSDLRAVERAMEDTGIAALAGRPAGHLSGGELQKVQIARALCQQTELLMLDEPTGNLDLGAQRECLDLVARLHCDRKLTTMIVMHDLRSLPAACNRALILDDGRATYDGPFRDVFNETNLAHVYKGSGRAALAELLADLGRAGKGAP